MNRQCKRREASIRTAVNRLTTQRTPVQAVTDQVNGITADRPDPPVYRRDWTIALVHFKMPTLE